MVRGTLSFKKSLIVILPVGLIMTNGCQSKSKNMSPDIGQYQEAVNRTALIPSMEPGSKTEQEAFKRFDDFYQVYSTEAIKKGIRRLYAKDAWFSDPFHTVEGIDDIEHYFLVMAEPAEECTFKIDDMQRVGSDYYARWTMKLISKAAKDEVIEAIGMSHVRFNAEGKIVFQQDYWDTSVMFDKLPVVGFWTRYVKGRIAKGLEK
jgi:hypothetical protein